METWRVRDIIPGMASADTLTPNRRFMQVIFECVPQEGYLNSKRTASRNFWDSFLGGKREDGAELNIAGDQLFISICDACGIDAERLEKMDWLNSATEFKKAIGMKVHALLATEYVEPYSINNSQSASDMRYRYTTLILDGEDVYQVFRNQQHIIIQDEDRLAEVKRMAADTAEYNEHAREARQRARGVASVGERRGTGAVVTERTLGGRGSSAEDGNDPALNRDESRRKSSNEPKA